MVVDRVRLTGTKTRFKHIKMRYPFQARFSIKVGVIMTTKKFHSQFAEMPMACLRQG
jgi:hypothetical protein